MLEAELFVKATLQRLRDSYRSTANVQHIYAQGSKILSEVQRINGSDDSLSVAALESFLADILITYANSTEEILIARDLSSVSLSRIVSVRKPSEELKKLAVHTTLLNAIAYKAMGERDLAFTSIERNQARLSNLLGINQVDAVPLRRQIVLMSQRKDNFVKLANEALSYRISHPAEYYASLKRFFEFLLNQRYISLAREAFPAFRQAYTIASANLTIVARVSFLKNVGQFLILDGFPRKGIAILELSLRAAAQLRMYGQVKQINRLIGDAYLGIPILETFRI